MYFSDRLRTTIWVASVTAGVLVILYPLLTGLYLPKQPYLIPLTQQVNNIITVGVIIAIAFPAFVEYSNYRWVRQFEGAVPRLLRDIAEAVRSGETLTKAVEVAAEKGSDPLSKELARVIALFVLGASWEESVCTLNKQIKSPTVQRLATILVEANESGGKTSEILGMSVELLSSLDQYKEEQQNNMKPYLYTIYASIAIFLIISFVVISQFLFPLASPTANQVSMKANSMNILDINYYVSILFWAATVEAFFGGIIAGKIGDRTYPAGLRHSVFLIIISLVCFNIMGGFW